MTGEYWQKITALQQQVEQQEQTRKKAAAVVEQIFREVSENFLPIKNAPHKLVRTWERREKDSIASVTLLAWGNKFDLSLEERELVRKISVQDKNIDPATIPDSIVAIDCNRIAAVTRRDAVTLFETGAAFPIRQIMTNPDAFLSDLARLLENPTPVHETIKKYQDYWRALFRGTPIKKISFPSTLDLKLEKKIGPLQNIF